MRRLFSKAAALSRKIRDSALFSWMVLLVACGFFLYLHGNHGQGLGATLVALSIACGAFGWTLALGYRLRSRPSTILPKVLSLVSGWIWLIFGAVLWHKEFDVSNVLRASRLAASTHGLDNARALVYDEWLFAAAGCLTLVTWVVMLRRFLYLKIWDVSEDRS
jgi:hypothetical protein